MDDESSHKIEIINLKHERLATDVKNLYACNNDMKKEIALLERKQDVIVNEIKTIKVPLWAVCLAVIGWIIQALARVIQSGPIQ
jgi:hypothetical protein